MNNEETRNYEENENIGEVEVYNEPVSSNGGIIGKIAIGALAVGAGVAAFIYKTKDKREARRIKKLEEKGYIITKPHVIDEKELVSDED